MALAAILAACFARFLFGHASLMESPRENASIYREGAAVGRPASPMRVVDNASGWETEPWLAIQHRIVVGEHRLPFWNPYEGYGEPFAAAMQPQPFYPPTALLALAPSPRAFSWWIVVRLFICGWFAALFMRLFADRYAALGAGAACALTGYFQTYLNMPHVSAETALPALLWSTELLCRRVTGPRVAMLALAAGLCDVGGMPEATFLALGVALLYGLLRLLTTREAIVARLGALAGAQALGAAIGAIAILPFLGYLHSSFNIHDPALTGIIIGLQADPEWLHGLVGELLPHAFGAAQRAILAPDGVGFTGLRGFVGVTTAFLAVLACITFVRRHDERRNVVLFLACVCAYVLCKRYGVPWINWTGALPILRMVYLAKYLEPLLGISTGLLAGFGIASLRERRASTAEVTVTVGIVLAALTALFLTTRGEIGDTPAMWPYPLAFALGLGALLSATFAALAIVRETAWLRAAGTVVIVLGLTVEPVAGYLAPVYWFDSAPIAENPYAGAPYIAYLQARIGDGSQRVFGFTDLYPNWSGAFGLADPRSLNAMYPDAYLKFVDAFLHTNGPANTVNGYDRFVSADPQIVSSSLGRRWLRLSSIGYLVSTRPLALGGTIPDASHTQSSPFALVFASTGAYVYRVPDAPPRVRLVHDVRSARTLDDALAAVTASGFDDQRSAVVEGTAMSAPEAGTESTAVRLRRSDRVDIDVVASSPALLVQSDVFFPGWSATVDGNPTPILRTDGLLRGVPIAVGAHHVTFAYDPLEVRFGILLTIAGLLVAIALCALPQFRPAR